MKLFNQQNARTLALIVAAASPLSAQIDPGERIQDQIAHRDAARAAAAADPGGIIHLQRAMNMLGNLGATSDDSFRVINVRKDDRGGTHARLQQYHQGVKVVNGQIISHQNARGEFSEYTNALKIRIDVGTQPGLSLAAALQSLARQTAPASADAVDPKIELVILPLMERYLIATGAAIEAPPAVRVADEKPGASREVGFGAPPDATNSDQTARRVKSYRLAYQIQKVQGRIGLGNVSATLYYLDANTGEIIDQHPMEDQAAAVGTGNGKFSGTVNLSTWNTGSGYKMFDSPRNYSTFDNDRSTSSPENRDADNSWGDGLFFLGDNLPVVANRQTAMVDGMFGASVYWDMMSNVFATRGPNNNYYDVNIYTHAKTNYDDTYYSRATGNIYLGDGPTRQALDCLGHEGGHGLNDFTAGLGNSGESGGLNESNSDILGAMTTFYLSGGQFSVHDMFLPGAGGGGSWTSVCSGRNMQKPSTQGPKQSDYWFPGIRFSDVHDAGAPHNRAFYFLSEGASAVSTNPDYSTLLPWGMTGLGPDRAAKLWINALEMYLTDDADYNDARAAMLLWAWNYSGPASDEAKAVQNAYAAVNVGQRAPGYPVLPPVISEVEPNNSSASAMKVAIPSAPKPAYSPSKLSISGGGTDEDWYLVDVQPGNKITVRLESSVFTDYDLEIFTPQKTLVGSSIKPMGFADQLSLTPTFSTYYVRVHQYASQTAGNFYKLLFEWN